LKKNFKLFSKKADSDSMRCLLLGFLFTFLCSCHAFFEWEEVVHSLKDQTLTELASQNAGGVFTQVQKAQLLLLFLDMEDTQGCNELVRLVENNDFSEDYRESENLTKGFLFDVFSGYTYEELVFSSPDHNDSFKRTGWLIANTWKTEFSTERINSVLSDLTYCYPY